MQVQELGAVVAAGIGIVFTTWSTWDFCLQTHRGDATPRLPSWYIFSLGSILSTLSYFSGHSGQTPTAVVGAYVAINAIANTAIMLVARRAPHVDKRMGKSDYACFALALVGLAVWGAILLGLWSPEQKWIADLAFQGVMTAGFWPTLQPLWKSDRNTEPVLAWLLALVASASGTIPAFLAPKGIDWSGLWFPVRATASILAALWAMRRAHNRGQRAKQQP